MTEAMISNWRGEMVQEAEKSDRHGMRIWMSLFRHIWNQRGRRKKEIADIWSMKNI